MRFPGLERDNEVREVLIELGSGRGLKGSTGSGRPLGRSLKIAESGPRESQGHDLTWGPTVQQFHEV